MECPQFDQNKESTFFQRIGLNQRRMPASGSMELTFCCNLHCKHCYIGDHRSGQSQLKELSTDEIRGILDQMADAGTLWLLLTGGEPLLRPDFQEIYSYAKHKGFILSLFTNGTLLTPEKVDFLADLPPHNTEITLYGATQETYERVTGIKGSFARCMQGIDLLMSRGIYLKLKAMAMTLTVVDIPAMQAFAQSLGVEFRYDPMLINDIDRRQSPYPLRLSAEEIVQLELADSVRLQEWQRFYNQQSGIEINKELLFSCGAGINNYHIDPFGRLTVCMSAREKSFDLRKGSFKEGWEVFLRQVRFSPASEKGQCSSCKIRPLCGLCPAWTESDGGIPDMPIDYLCQIGHRRAQAFDLYS